MRAALLEEELAFLFSVAALAASSSPAFAYGLAAVSANTGAGIIGPAVESSRAAATVP